LTSIKERKMLDDILIANELYFKIKIKIANEVVAEAKKKKEAILFNVDLRKLKLKYKVKFNIKY